MPRAIRGRLQAIRDTESRWRGYSDEQLRERGRQLRLQVVHASPDDADAQIATFALACEALRRARGIQLYDVQLVAALALARGAIVQMQTGEGKTFACFPAACLHALTGRGVHVAAPNEYLARRDGQLLLPAYQLLGIDAALLPEKDWRPADKRDAYQRDVVYGTGYEFGFDYLRDQLGLREHSRRQLGTQTLKHLGGVELPDNRTVQRGLYYAIVDEADDVLVDDATSPMVLSGSPQGDAPDADVHEAARRIVSDLLPEQHYRLTARGAQLTDEGIELIHDAWDQFPIMRLQRTWTEYVEHALRATMLKRDIHYIVTADHRVRIVDAGTGRIFADRTWRAGLHQAVEAKEGVRITAEMSALAQITRQRFARLYTRLAGMTGTAHGCEREFRQVYGLDVVPIPLRTPSRRDTWPTRYFANTMAKWHAIAKSVLNVHRQQRPILIGTANIADSQSLAVLLHDYGLEIEVLNGRQDADEADIISQAGQPHAVTIATNLAGRGTDIKLGPGVAERGGLHVVVAECSESARVDRQLLGRCARQGDPGSAQMFVSAEDPLIQQYGEWLVRSIQRYASPTGEIAIDFHGQLRRIQGSAERSNRAARAALLRRDVSRDSVFSGQTAES